MLGDEASLDAAERWVDDWQAGIAERAARAKELSERVAQLSATARSGDGLVEVTVSASGVVSGLSLDERVRDWPAARIAEQVMAVMRAAHERLTEQVTEATADTVGLDDPAGRAVVESFASRVHGPAHGGDDASR
jgi:DNA-binding protein YbaB